MTLAEKEEEVRAELLRWAKDNNILGPGDQLIFTLKVKRNPPVVSTEPNDVRKVRARRFFTVERFKKAGRPRSRNYFFRELGLFGGNSITVGEVIQLPTFCKLIQTDVSYVPAIRGMLAEVGIEV